VKGRRVARGTLSFQDRASSSPGLPGRRPALLPAGGNAGIAVSTGRRRTLAVMLGGTLPIPLYVL
jgi:hypothetical protein